MINLPKIIKDIVQVSIPLSKSAKRKIIDEAKGKAEDYRLKISNEVGVDLPQVDVRPYQHRINNIAEVLCNNDLRKKMLFRTIVYPIVKPISMYQEDCFSAVYEPRIKQPTIYIAFGFANKLNMICTGSFINDSTLVHELSHHLWFTIGGQKALDDLKSESFKFYSKWAEDFADYCSLKKFRHIYPENEYIPNLKEPNLLETLVSQYGEQTITEVPIRWKEFNQKLF